MPLLWDDKLQDQDRAIRNAIEMNNTMTGSQPGFQQCAICVAQQKFDGGRGAQVHCVVQGAASLVGEAVRYASWEVGTQQVRHKWHSVTRPFGGHVAGSAEECRLPRVTGTELVARFACADTPDWF